MVIIVEVGPVASARDDPSVSRRLVFASSEESLHLKIGSAPDAEIPLVDGPSFAGSLLAEMVATGRKKNPHRLVLHHIPNWRGDLAVAEAELGDPVEIDVGNSLDFGGESVAIIELSDQNPPTEEKEGEEEVPGEESAPSPPSWWARVYRTVRTAFQPVFAWPLRQRLAQSSELKRIRRGAREFPRIIRKFACTVNEPEVARVEPILNQGVRFSRVAGLGFALLCFLVLAILPVDSPHLMDWAKGIAVLTLVLIFCASFFNAPGIALTFVLGAATWATLAFPQHGLSGDFINPAIGTILIITPFIGLMLEHGMCSLPRWDHSAITGFLGALLLSLGIASMNFLIREEIPAWGKVFLIGSPVAILLWIFVAIPLRQRWYLKELNCDGVSLLSLAWFRWRGRLLTRTFCLAVGIIPVLSLVHLIDMKAHLSDSSLAGVITDSSNTEESGGRDAWLWVEKAKPLSKQDLNSFRFYIATPDQLSELKESTTDSRYSSLTKRIVAYEFQDTPELLAFLAEKKLESEDQFLSAFGPDTEKKEAKLWYLREPDDPDAGTLRLFHASLVPADLDEIRAKIRVVQLFLTPAIVMGLFGILVAWRGEGRGHLGQLIVTWALGFAGAVTVIPVMGFLGGGQDSVLIHLGPLYSSLQDLGEVSLLAQLIQPVYFFLLAFFAAVLLSFYLHATFTPIVWVLPAGENVLVTRLLRMFFAFLPVALVIAVAIFLSPIDSDEQSGHFRQPKVLFLWFLALTLPLGIAAGIHFFRKKGGLPLRETTVWHLLAFGIPNLLALMLVFHGDYANERVYTVLVIGLTVVLVFSLIHLVLRKNVWNLGGGKTIGTALTVIALPIVIEIFDNLVLSSLESVNVIPATAATIASVFFAVALFNPAHRVATRLLRFVTLRSDHRKAINRTNELVNAVVQSQDSGERGEHLESLLADLDMQHYAIYSRWGRGDGVYRCVGTDYADWTPPELTLSQRLQDLLSSETSFVHIDRVVLEFGYVLNAPELWRVQQTLGHYSVVSADTPHSLRRCEHLLCISIGDVLCAFVAFGDLPANETVRNDGCVEQLRNVAVASSIPG